MLKFGWYFLLMLSRDSEDQDLCLNFWYDFKKLLWQDELNPGPLCLWQCLISKLDWSPLWALSLKETEMKAWKRWLECPLWGRCPLPQWLGSSRDSLMLSSPDPDLDLALPLLRLDLVEGRRSAWSGWGVSMSISLSFHFPLWAENTLTSMAVRSTGARHHYLTEIHRHQLNQPTQGFIFVFCILSFVKATIYYLLHSQY